MNRTPTPEDYLQAGLGYGLSRQSRIRYQQIASDVERDERAVEKVREKIEWAFSAYERAKARYREDDIRTYTELTLHWSPERVFSTYKHFPKLVEYFSNQRAWRRLSRKDRKFFADAYEYYVEAISQR